ncbi:GTPase IMAP family member 8-like [Leuresthes tenuis]|uniref:GTPase IMAP family member 8-like n=1 Tax=Leuresthes tenuis TaxID=355514 RepID=UPI003B50768A
MAADLRVVLLGKTGAGKSSFAEAIFGEEVFEMDDSANSGTSECQSATREVNGRNITVIDTPGFFDNRRNEEDLKAEILKCITECSPGPHAFLILLKVEKFTQHEKLCQEIVSEIKETFYEEAFKHAVVVFTHGDQLRKGMKIEEFVRGNEHLQDLLEKCGGRCHVVDNKYWKNNQQDEYRNNQIQVGNLLNTITEMVNNRGFYTNEMLQKVNRLIQEEERRIQSSSGHMSQEDRKSQAKKNVFNFLKKAAGVTTGMWFRSLLGVPVMVGTVALVLKAMRPAMGGVAAGLAGAAAASTVGVADLRIVLVGKTGAGKSSFTEAIFGEKVFEMDDSANSETSKCQSATREVNGRNITVIDTPGFFDNVRNEEDLEAEILKCITECSSGPHAFLILLKVEKFMEHEKHLISKIKETFSEEAFRHAVVVFTHGDQLPEGMTIEEFVRGNEDLQDLLEKCGGRCHVVDSKYWKNNQQDEYRNNQIQVGNLLNTITEMVNNRGFYTNEMLQAVNRQIQEAERRFQSSSGHMSKCSIT